MKIGRGHYLHMYYLGSFLSEMERAPLRAYYRMLMNQWFLLQVVFLCDKDLVIKLC